MESFCPPLVLAAATRVAAAPAFQAPWLLSCEHDADWTSYAATLAAFEREASPPPAAVPGLPGICTAWDIALYHLSDNILAAGFPTGDALDTFMNLHHRCDVPGGLPIGDEACKLSGEAGACFYGIVAASACMAIMYMQNAATMSAHYAPTAIGSAKLLKNLLTNGEKALEFLDSSTWPLTVRDVVTIVGAYDPILALAEARGDEAAAAAVERIAQAPESVVPRWAERDGSPQVRQRASEALALVATWRWPPGRAVAEGGTAGWAAEAGEAAVEPRPRRVRIFAFGTHCSVMAEPVSAVALMLPGDFELQVTWRGTKEYCGYHTGDWPIVERDEASPLREVYEAFHEREDLDAAQPRLHRDSIRSPREFEEAMRKALALEGDNFADAELALCNEPALACVTMHEMGKPVLGYFGVHAAFMLRERGDQMDFYRRFRDQLAQDPRSTFATVAPYISLQMFYHVPVEVPAVRPLALYTLPAAYTQARPEGVLINKRPVAIFDVTATLQGFARLNGAPFDFLDSTELYRAHGHVGYQTWADFRAGVYFPYDWLQTMAFYDWLSMGLPTFVPDNPMYTISRGTNAHDAWEAAVWHVPPSVYPHHYSAWDDLEGRVYWWLLTDFKALPGVRTFGTVAELFGGLASLEELWTTSGILREAKLQRVASTTLFWRTALLRALAAPTVG